MKGTLYGIGVGPGDKKLLTVLAIETLKNVDVIIIPDTGGEKTALKVVEDYIKDKEKCFSLMPMTRDKQLLKKSHEDCADTICKKLDEGKDVAFITLGDPTIYSTYMYVHRIVDNAGYNVKIINGIPSFCAAAAKLNISLCDGKEALHIIPASYEGSQELLALKGNKVLMKSGKSMNAIKNMLKELNLLKNAKMAECCCMENEKLYDDITSATEESYFSVIIVKGE